MLSLILAIALGSELFLDPVDGWEGAILFEVLSVAKKCPDHALKFTFYPETKRESPMFKFRCAYDIPLAPIPRIDKAG